MGMIERLIELVTLEIDQTRRRLAELDAERTELAEQAEYWRAQFSGALGFNEGHAPEAIRDWLNWGAKADRELQNLGEKDFLVETRISECRKTLLALERRREMFEEIVARRQRDEKRRANRLQERERVQRGAARMAKARGDELWR